MAARIVLAVVSVVFFVAAAVRIVRGHAVSHPQVRTWLLVGGIFALVSGWLSLTGS